MRIGDVVSSLLQITNDPNHPLELLHVMTMRNVNRYVPLEKLLFLPNLCDAFIECWHASWLNCICVWLYVGVSFEEVYSFRLPSYSTDFATSFAKKIKQMSPRTPYRVSLMILECNSGTQRVSNVIHNVPSDGLTLQAWWKRFHAVVTGSYALNANTNDDDDDDDDDPYSVKRQINRRLALNLP